METRSKILENLHVNTYNVYLPHLLNYLNERKKNFHAGCISDASLLWRKFISDPEILDTVHGMHIEFNELPVQSVPCLQSYIGKENHKLVDDEISLLIEKRLLCHLHMSLVNLSHQYLFEVKRWLFSYGVKLKAFE